MELDRWFDVKFFITISKDRLFINKRLYDLHLLYDANIDSKITNQN